MKNIYKILGLLFICLMVNACEDSPVDDRGLLITDSEECYMSNFEVRGPDDRNVIVSYAIEDVDEAHGVIKAVAAFGTNLKHVKPHCSIAKDAILEPMMGSWMDFSQTKEYTVISGNRKVKKTYTITITLQGE